MDPRSSRKTGRNDWISYIFVGILNELFRTDGKKDINKSDLTICQSSPESWTQTDKPRWREVLPVLSCSLMRPLISSSWWRSEVSRSGRRSPTLGCSLAMVAAVLGMEVASLLRCPSLPAWRTPGATHQYSLQAPLHQSTNIWWISSDNINSVRRMC